MSMDNVNWNNVRNFFRPGLFEKMIQDHGKDMIWQQSAWCPDFMGNDLDQHAINCTNCDASGLVYRVPETPVDGKIRAISQAINLQHVYRAEGRFDLGTQVVTLSRDLDVNIWDKLIYLSSLARYREVIKRNSVNATDRPQYDIIRVLHVSTPEREYKVNEDFVIDNGQIKWTLSEAGGRPPVGDIYTVDYNHHPVYIVVDMANEIRNAHNPVHPLSEQEMFTEFPKRVLAKRDFLLRDESTDIRE